MKKVLLLLLLLPLFLSGCGGGGSDEVSSGVPSGGTDTVSGGENLDGVATPVDGNTGKITVTFGPQVQPQKALVDGSSWVRNHARLVVRKVETIENTRTQDIVETECFYDDSGEIIDCVDTVVGQETVVVSVVETETFKDIVDGGLDPATGMGTLTMEVPPGEGYTLEVLTYCQDVPGSYTYVDLNGQEQSADFSACGDPNGTQGYVAQNVNFIMQYAKNNDGTPEKNSTTFDVIGGQETSVHISLASDLAQLQLPTDPVVADSDYEVSVASKSDALSNSLWYVLQTVDEMDLSNQWYYHEDTDTDLVFNNGPVSSPISLHAPYEAASGTGEFAPNWKMWHHGQFFISSHLLNDEEDEEKWIFGTSYAGELNPLGGVNVVWN